MPQDSSPQNKKRKSLQRDGRNCYGENDKSSRKAIRRRKAIVNRSFRRETKQTLCQSIADPDALHQDVDEVKRLDWKKVPDKPLGDHLLDKLVSQITKRLSEASEPTRLLDDVETQLINNDVPPPAVQDIMRQLHSVVRARWSTSFPLGSRAVPLKIEFSLAKTIADILKHKKA